MVFHRRFDVFFLLCIPWAAFSSVHTASTSDQLLDRLSRVEPGDTILVQPGEYTDHTVNSSHEAFNPARSGTAQRPIVIRSAQLHQAVLRAPTDTRPAMGIYQREHIIIEGFRVEGAIGFRENANHGILRNCDISRGYIQGGDKSLHWGAYIQTSEHCIIENNYVHDMAPIGSGTHNGACIMVFGSSNNIIQNNTADGGGIMFSTFGQKSGPVCDNIWRRNIARNASKSAFLGMGSTDETRYSERNVYYENIAMNMETFIDLNHNCNEWKIYNNTAYNVRVFLYGGYQSADKNNTAMEVWNNIGGRRMYRQNKSTPSSWNDLIVFSDVNVFPQDACSWQSDSRTMSLSEWQQQTGLDINSMQMKPEFVDAEGGDFTLPENSPLINAGIERGSYSQGYEGRPPDIGAYPRNNDNTLIGHDWRLQKIGDTHPRPKRSSTHETSAVDPSSAHVKNATGSARGFIERTELNLILPSDHSFTAARVYDMSGRTVARFTLAQINSGGIYRLPLGDRASRLGSRPLLCELTGAQARSVVRLSTRQ